MDEGPLTHLRPFFSFARPLCADLAASRRNLAAPRYFGTLSQNGNQTRNEKCQGKCSMEMSEGLLKRRWLTIPELARWDGSSDAPCSGVEHIFLRTLARTVPSRQLRRAAPKDWADSYLIAFTETAGLQLVTFDRAVAYRTDRVVFLKTEK